jgi:N-acetylmuramic acid 6-phosphate etherase
MISSDQSRPISEAARRESLLASLFAGQRRAVQQVAEAAPALLEASTRVASGLRAGGRLIYAGAGSSGLLAMQDGLELPGTFGVDAGRICFVTPDRDRFLDSSAEDDEAGAVAAIESLDLGADDLVIAVSASGSTPFTLAAARRARAKRASIVAIVCRTNSPLALAADVRVVLETGREAVEGSTRLAAGTAQKAALSVISTLAFAELGCVYDGLMVNVRPENAKLRKRAASIVAKLANVDDETAFKALDTGGGDVAASVAAAAGRLDSAAARALASECGGQVAQVLARIHTRK